MQYKHLLYFLFFVFTFLYDTGTISAQRSRCYNLITVLNRPAPLAYRPHLNTARGFHINILENSAQIMRYVKAGKIVKIAASGKGYATHSLTHSRPYLAPKAKNVLKQIAQQFYTKSKRNSFSITSLTRTLDDQCRLRRVNRNATMGASTHNYACSFDISYVRFNKRHVRNLRLERTLYAVLQQFHQQGKIYFIKERNQQCFHVTVRS